MSRLLGVLTNDPERLACVLHPDQETLSLGESVAGWGVAFHQLGEVLVQRHPKPSPDGVDFFDLARARTAESVVAHAAGAGRVLRLEDTQPFRFHSWVYAQLGECPEFGRIRERVLEHTPDFLRRSARGESVAETLFHLFLAFLHDANRLDELKPGPTDVAEALQAMVFFLDTLCKGARTPLAVIASNGRTLVALGRGRPTYLRRIRGVVDCPMCRVPGESFADTRKVNHDRLTATLVLGGFPDEPGLGWERLPDASILQVGRDSLTHLPLRE